MDKLGGQFGVIEDVIVVKRLLDQQQAKLIQLVHHVAVGEQTAGRGVVEVEAQPVDVEPEGDPEQLREVEGGHRLQPQPSPAR